MTTFGIVAGRSTVLVAARSSMGPIVFETTAVTGTVDAEIHDGVINHDGASAHVEVDMNSLQSGNDVYDAELRRRLDTRRHPLCTVDLERTTVLADDRYSLKGNITVHGSTRPIDGTVEVRARGDERIMVTGSRVVDIRDFGIPAPGILMLKIYPEVEVQIFVEARRGGGEGEPT